MTPCASWIASIASSAAAAAGDLVTAGAVDLQVAEAGREDPVEALVGRARRGPVAGGRDRARPRTRPSPARACRRAPARPRAAGSRRRPATAGSAGLGAGAASRPSPAGARRRTRGSSRELVPEQARPGPVRRRARTTAAARARGRARRSTGARTCQADVTTVTRRTSPIARMSGSERMAFSAVLRPASSSTRRHVGEPTTPPSSARPPRARRSCGVAGEDHRPRRVARGTRARRAAGAHATRRRCGARG